MTHKITQKKTTKVPEKWLQLYAHGLIQGLSEVKPILLFTDKKEREVFPLGVDFVEMDSLEHYFQLGQAAKTSQHPYQTHIKILQELGWKIDRLCFNKMDGYRIYASLVLVKEGKEKTFIERAEDVILLALCSKAKIFTSREILHKVKDIKDLKHLKGLDFQLGDYRESQKYLM